MNGAINFRSSVWDPTTIIIQMIALQFIYYTSLSLIFVFIDYMADVNRSLDQIFRHEIVSAKDSNGRTIICTFLVNSFLCAFGLLNIVRRAKSCLDFAATMVFWHLIFCWFHTNAFPTTFIWWLLQLICIVTSTVLGEYLCMKQEMKAIPLSSRSDV